MVQKRKYKFNVRKKFKFFFLVLKKRKKLKLKLKIGYLIFKQVHSNYFITFVDKKFRTIICVTSGNSKVGDSIRKKVSPYAMENISNRLVPYLKLYKLKFLYIYVHTKPGAAFFALIQQLRLHRIKIKRIHERIHVPHNGIRKRKPRRK